jgi:hypothetical protein
MTVTNERSTIMKNSPKLRLFTRLAESLGLTEAVEKNDYETCRERLRSADFQTLVTLANGERPFGEEHWLYGLADAEKRRRLTEMHKANTERNQAAQMEACEKELVEHQMSLEIVEKMAAWHTSH